MAVVDRATTKRAASSSRPWSNSQYFDVALNLQSEAQVIQSIDEGQAKAGIVIPPDFAARSSRGDANVLIILDGSDSFSVQSGYSAASAVAQTFSLA